MTDLAPRELNLWPVQVDLLTHNPGINTVHKMSSDERCFVSWDFLFFFPVKRRKTNWLSTITERLWVNNESLKHKIKKRQNHKQHPKMYLHNPAKTNWALVSELIIYQIYSQYISYARSFFFLYVSLWLVIQKKNKSCLLFRPVTLHPFYWLVNWSHNPKHQRSVFNKQQH